MLLLSVLACTHTAPPPAPEPEPEPVVAGDRDEAEALRCEAKVPRACVTLALRLARESQPQRALAVADPGCSEGDELLCMVGTLVALATPDTPPEGFLERLCELGTAHACVLRARTAGGDAARWWSRACDHGDPLACEIRDGTVPAEPKSAPLPPELAERFAEAGVQLSTPFGFVPVPVRDNPDLAYHYALQTADGTAEIRYRVDPLAPILAEKAACELRPDCAMVDPNRIGEAMGMATALNISGGQATSPSNFPVPPVILEFGADWGQIWHLEPREAFALGFDRAALMTLHRDDVGDVTVVFLGRGPDALELAMRRGFHSLRFSAPHGP